MQGKTVAILESRLGPQLGELITKHGTYTYEVDRNFVKPEAGAGVVLEQTRRPTLVLTTCNPKYSSSQRLIVTATLVSAPVGA